MRKRIEHGLEVGIFASRWILAPIYVGLVFSLFVVLWMFVKEFIHVFEDVLHPEPDSTLDQQAGGLTLGVLGLLDLALLANLILIVIFAGYENFVSKINVANDSEDRPHWMGHVDFSGLKIKLIGSLVAISVIELLQDFIQAAERPLDWESVGWRIGLHMTFLFSGVLFAVMDYIGDKRKVLLDVHTAEMKDRGEKPRADRADGT